MGSESKKRKKNPDAKMNCVFGSRNKEITDERFALSQKDPRFQDVPRHKTKVAIDSRFSHVFTDNNFSTSSARVDKRGRSKQDGDSSQSALRHYYRMDNEENKQKKQLQKGEYESDDPAHSIWTISETESLGEEKGEEDLMDDDYTSIDTDEVYLEEETTATGLQLQENIPETDKLTHRLAIVGMDWNQVQAVDLFVLLSSFLPKGGQILSVSVYPSEFGLERMEEEEVHGPVALFNDEDQESDNDDNEIDNEKLRAYELSRLKYYVAVVVCDSIATADCLYMSCDGVEFERSSNILDLRFIPDSMEFEHPARDVAIEAPPNYEGNDFQTRALQQSKIDSTWDKNEDRRSKMLTREFNVYQESEYDKHEQGWREYIASSETDEDEKIQKTDKHRALVQSGDEDEDEDEDDKGMEMEVTFNTGLENLSKKILEKKHKKSETVWDVVLRKKKEKKKARKDQCIGYDSDREEVADFFLGDKKLEKMRLGKEGEASKAKLELLLGGNDDGNVRGYNLKKNKSKGKKRKKEGMGEVKIPNADYDDPRYSSIFTRPDFALDPTNPQFKRRSVYARQFAHKQHKGDMDRKGGQQHERTHAAAEVDKIDSKKEKNDILMLVKCVKMKSKQLPLSSDGNKSRWKGK